MDTATRTAPLTRLIDQINRTLIGKEETVLRTVVALLARGHLLIEDVPGIGKTLLALTLARSLGATFRRVQFTNDLLPSDILGVSVYNQKEQRFELHRGPIFSHVLLADEINRSTPKTQSALLEAMGERQVTLEGETFELPDPFLVIATENPVEYHGTFPLPEAQLDRFLMRIRLGYPEPEDEKRILQGGDLEQRLKAVEPALSVSETAALQRRAAEVRMDDSLLEYVVALARATRQTEGVRLGLSPRGAQALCQAARALALVSGRDYCVPDDVKRVAVPVAAHRLVLDTAAHGAAKAAEAERLVESVLRRVPPPR